MTEPGESSNTVIPQTHPRAELMSRFGSSFSDLQANFDILKTEISANTPQQDKDLGIKALEFTEKMKSLYGKYLPSEKLKRLPGAHERVMLVTGDDFNTYFSIKNRGEYRGEVRQFRGENNNGFIIMKREDDIEGFSRLSPEEQKNFLEIYGSVNAEKEANKRYFNYVLAHELSHSFQSFPSSVFTEAGAAFYGHQLSPEFPIRPQAEFYERLISQFGEDVHKLYFGLPVDDAIKAMILKEVEKEKGLTRITYKQPLSKRIRKFLTFR